MAMKMFTALILGGSVLLQLAALALAAPFHTGIPIHTGFPTNTEVPTHTGILIHPRTRSLINSTATALITRPIPTKLPILPHFVRKTTEPEELRGKILDTLKCFPSKPAAGAEEFLDSHKDNALWAADHFCATEAKEHDGAKAPIGLISHTYDTRHERGQIVNIPQALSSPRPDMQDHWQVNVTDTETCNLGLVEERYMERPTGQYDCKALMFATWRQCNNKGRGGSVEAGCMKFSMHPLW